MLVLGVQYNDTKMIFFVGRIFRHYKHFCDSILVGKSILALGEIPRNEIIGSMGGNGSYPGG